MTDLDQFETISARLRSPELAERDAATNALVQLASLPAAQLLDGLETAPETVKARSLYSFVGSHRHQQGRRLEATADHHLDIDGNLSEALAWIEAHCPILFRIELRAADRPVALSRKGTPLELLDALCRETGTELIIGRLGVAEIVDASTPRYPSEFDGAAVAWISEVKTERTSNFAETTTRASLRIKAAFEWPLTPMTAPSLQLRQVMVSGSSVDAQCQAVPQTDGSYEFSCAIADIPGQARALDVACAELLATFPSGYRDYLLADPTSGHRLETSQFRVIIEEVKDDGYLISVSPTSAASESALKSVLNQAVSNVILGVDDHGQEAIAKVSSIVAVRSDGAPTAPELKLRIQFARRGFGRPTELRLRVAEGTVTSTYQFMFRSVPLP